MLKQIILVVLFASLLVDSYEFAEAEALSWLAKRYNNPAFRRKAFPLDSFSFPDFSEEEAYVLVKSEGRRMRKRYKRRRSCGKPKVRTSKWAIYRRLKPKKTSKNSESVQIKIPSHHEQRRLFVNWTKEKIPGTNRYRKRKVYWNYARRVTDPRTNKPYWPKVLYKPIKEKIPGTNRYKTVFVEFKTSPLPWKKKYKHRKISYGRKYRKERKGSDKKGFKFEGDYIPNTIMTDKNSELVLVKIPDRYEQKNLYVKRVKERIHGTNRYRKRKVYYDLPTIKKIPGSNRYYLPKVYYEQIRERIPGTNERRTVFIKLEGKKKYNDRKPRRIACSKPRRRRLYKDVKRR